MKINRVFKMLRINEWLFSKLPFLFLPVLANLNYNSTFRENIPIILCYFIYLFAFLGFGYAINDYSDREIDKKVGKTNVMGELSNIKCLFVLGLLLAGCIPFGILYNNWIVWLLLIFVYFWGAAYSIRPFRFKEKGVAGLLVSSLAQRTIPLLPLLGVSKTYWCIVLICGIIGFFVGMRYILIHQYEDIKNDEISGTNTYVKSKNSGISKKIYILLFMECVLTVILIAKFTPFTITYILAAFCVLLSLIIFYTICKIYKKSYFTSFICVPMEDMYNFYLPISILIILLQRDVLWALPLCALVIISTKDMINKWKIAIFGITHWRNHK